MCGIFALLNNNGYFSEEVVNQEFEKGKGRGPEFSKMTNIQENDKLTLGFHRLAINGLDEQSHQPLIIGNIALIVVVLGIIWSAVMWKKE